MNGMLRFNGAVACEPEIDAWLNTGADALCLIARQWFAQMRRCGEDVLELLHDGCPVALVNDVPFAYVNIFKAHVNVGFFQGASLPDPAGLLQGSGKRMRHVKLRPDEQFDFSALSALVSAAYTDVVRRLEAE